MVHHTMETNIKWNDRNGTPYYGDTYKMECQEWYTILWRQSFPNIIMFRFVFVFFLKPGHPRSSPRPYTYVYVHISIITV